MRYSLQKTPPHSRLRENRPAGSGSRTACNLSHPAVSITCLRHDGGRWQGSGGLEAGSQ
ncbi:Hypothetical protein GbCGDNIH3_7129 [Granulibacter bethesdensis]|uniref:Uncharacterized protein n=1 Tax=Granulibacter bethesdensis TaxID=364410 RepID=A0AAN0VFK9_9PROT|nr:Hypothetical protein GbCGDNIH3_7129 [Granulibacter bethesdensis]AHJ66594.1 Hypothetical protein GbCGDNIH4_7126 [Granulibacter bethesdensis CGDNIH4]APH59343.1 Hypothetical protein GbCGDNIH7_7129 [Granulibacter bethesdensis]